MTVMKDETFGPVLPIMKVSSDEEAVALMNDSEYGLTASVWTRDIARGEELIAEIEAGTVFINRCDYPSPVCTSSLLLSEDPRVGSANEAIGSCVGWVEELRVGMYAGSACV
jgi:acyl-CoA reductase-like NAD-dependent aldehyde dehydrogenase